MDNALTTARHDAIIARAIAAAARRKALESARATYGAGELAVLSLRRERDVSRALVERLSGHLGCGESSRTARLTVVNSNSKGEQS